MEDGCKSRVVTVTDGLRELEFQWSIFSALGNEVPKRVDRPVGKSIVNICMIVALNHYQLIKHFEVQLLLCGLSVSYTVSVLKT